MLKARLFINGCSLKNRGNDEDGLLSRPRRASLKGVYAALLILTIGQLFSSINALPVSLLILAEPRILNATWVCTSR